MIFFTMPADKIKSPNITIDDKLILKIATGDMDALKVVYSTTKHAIYGFALSILKNKDDAEDVLQETYINLVSASKTYVPKKKAMALLFTICRNLCLGKLREHKNISGDEVDLNKVEDLTFDTITQYEDRIVLETVMKILAESEREIIILHITAGFKFREIASILNIPLATVLSKYNRAIKKLRLLLEKEAY